MESGAAPDQRQHQLTEEITIKASTTTNDDNIVNNTNDDDDEEEDISSILAALTRTLTRFLQQLLKTGIKSSSTIAIGNIPARHIAKLADKTSMIMDYVEVTPTIADVKRSLEMHGVKGVLKHVREFVIGLGKSSLAGILVYEGYDYIVEGYMKDYSDGRGEAPLHINAGAGFIAGFGHGLLSTAFDSKFSTAKGQGGTYAKYGVSLTPPFELKSQFYGRFIHHSLSHSILFASFEGLKRTFNSYTKKSYEVQISSNDTKVDLIEVGSVALSGGLAGQIQMVASHYIELLETEGVVAGVKSLAFVKKGMRPTPPTVRSVMMAFPPMALGFTAFEYGKF